MGSLFQRMLPWRGALVCGLIVAGEATSISLLPTVSVSPGAVCDRAEKTELRKVHTPRSTCMHHLSSSFIKSSSQDNTGEVSERKRRHCISGIFFLAIKLLHHTPGHSGRRGSHRSGAAESWGARTELESEVACSRNAEGRSRKNGETTGDSHKNLEESIQVLT